MAVVPYTPRITTITLSVSSAGPFFVGFRLFDHDAVDVYLDGELLAPEQFSVSAAFADGYDDSASVLLAEPAPIGSKIRIEGAMRPQRAADYVPTDPSVLQKINVELGRVWAVLMELFRDTRRSLRLNRDVPVWEPQTNTIPVWDGEKFVGAPYITSIGDVADLADRAEAAAQVVSGGTRANFVALNTGSAFSAFSDGASVMADGLLYTRRSGAAVIPDLPGWVPGGAVTSLKHFDVVGNGASDDTAAWDAFQGAPGVKEIPPGTYLVNGAVKRFDAGCIGNGEYDDASAAWNQLLGDRERDSLIVHGRTINANTTLLSPTIKTQTVVNYEVDVPTSQFKRITDAWHEATLNGYYETSTDQNNNFTVMGAAVRNNMSGLFGSLASTWYCSDARESENPDVATRGATKNGCAYFQPTRRSRHSSGGYMFGTEVIFLNTSADSDTAIPFPNNDNFSGTWFVGSKITSGSNSAPTSAGLLINGSSTAKHTFWNGIVIGQSAFKINDNGAGPAGTVGINMASWRTAAGYGDIGIKFRTANRHLWFIEGAKIRSPHSRLMNEGGGCGVSIEGQTGFTQYLNFRSGASDAANGGAVSNTGQILSTPSQLTISAPGGELIFSPVGVASWRINANRLAPVTDNDFAIGSASARVSEVFAATGAINTSDENAKESISDIPEPVLDAWGEVGFQQFRFRDAVEQKGPDARLHSGLIAQRIEDVFAAHGLDAREWGLLCYDEWGAVEERVEISQVEVSPAVYEQILINEASFRIVKDDEGNEIEVEETPAQYVDGALVREAVYDEIKTVIPAVEAGSLYGIRYEEALCMEAAYQRRRADRIEARLEALEALLGAA